MEQEVIIYDYHSEDYDIIFKDSAYNAIMSDFAYCEIINYELRRYHCRNVLVIYIVK